MNFSLPLIIFISIIIALLIIFPLIISYKAEKRENFNEWDKIRKYSKKINDENRKKY